MGKKIDKSSPTCFFSARGGFKSLVKVSKNKIHLSPLLFRHVTHFLFCAVWREKENSQFVLKMQKTTSVHLTPSITEVQIII